MNNVIKFINVFTSQNKNKEVVEIFTNRCSYWFASILFRRFIRENAKIMYDKKTKHFGTLISDIVYDVTGDVTTQYAWTYWLDIDDKTRDKVMVEQIMF